MEPPPLDLSTALRDASTAIPLLLVLSPGVDPAARLAALAAESCVRLRSIALGQGQVRAASSGYAAHTGGM